MLRHSRAKSPTFVHFLSISWIIERQYSCYEWTKRSKISENAVVVWNPHSEFILNIIEEKNSIASPSHSKHLFGTVIFTPKIRLFKNGHKVHLEDF